MQKMSKSMKASKEVTWKLKDIQTSSIVAFHCRRTTGVISIYICSLLKRSVCTKLCICKFIKFENSQLEYFSLYKYFTYDGLCPSDLKFNALTIRPRHCSEI